MEQNIGFLQLTVSELSAWNVFDWNQKQKIIDISHSTCGVQNIIENNEQIANIAPPTMFSATFTRNLSRCF